MSTALARTTPGHSEQPRAVPYTLLPALQLVENVIQGLSHQPLISEAGVNALAVSAHLLARVVLADHNSLLGAPCSIDRYLRDWATMSETASDEHCTEEHPVWAIYRQFIDNAITGTPSEHSCGQDAAPHADENGHPRIHRRHHRQRHRLRRRQPHRTATDSHRGDARGLHPALPNHRHRRVIAHRRTHP
ncbi:hypothetical protein [Curtobacterium sp. MCBD17_040]|uniref:hypothetical protein n=1 Tax=Curtobacterium sp. MCBD17_040 TaxID=2175674 RepID=UPI0011B6FDDE|nr:hypothetical protein [Curtobacterium sp. MCBD17_040]WIB65330.1 hypothetical protein DEI94_18155 [Curtobacterium sp. MCBD17_040]